MRYKGSLFSGIVILNLLFFITLTLKAQPDEGQILENEGSRQYRNGNYSQAVELYQKALKVKPTRAEFYNNFATALAMIQRYEEAIAALNKATGINPDFEKAFTNLGEIYDRMNRPADSVDAFRQAVKINPKSIKAYTGLCKGYLAAERNSEAVDCYKELVSLNPFDQKAVNDYGYALNNLGNSLFNTGHYKEAIKVFDRAIEVVPDNLITHHNLAIAQLFNKNKAAALEQYAFLKKMDADLALHLYQIIYNGKLLLNVQLPAK